MTKATDGGAAVNVERTMPIMLGHRSEATVSSIRQARGFLAVVAVPWDSLSPHLTQALRNHGQTLARLAERGGLSACEALAIIEDRRWSAMDAGAAHEKLARLIIKHMQEPAR
jgi:hypothetical protein